MNKLLLILALLGGFLFFNCQSQTGITITKIDKDYLKKNVLGKDVQLVDVRTKEEYKAGHIDDAVNFNIVQRSAFLVQVESLDKNEPVYLYCKAGGRSNRAAQLLKERGFLKIFDYSGGYNDWVID